MLQHSVLKLFSAFVVCAVLLAIRRLFYHPLRRYPGPYVAAATGWYLTFYDIIKAGSFIEKLKDLHVQYGPVVRIAPNQLHYSEPAAYTDIYANHPKFTKDPQLYQAFGFTGSLFPASDLREVKARKEALSPLFSRRAIMKLEHVVQLKVAELIDRFSAFEKQRRPVEMYSAFRSLGMDVITEYCFARSVGCLDDPDLKHEILESWQKAVSAFWIFKHFPWAAHVFAWLPMSESHASVLRLRQMMESQVSSLLQDPELLTSVEHETVYHHLLAPSNKHQQYAPTKLSLVSEAMTLTGAGSDTVANTCTVGTFCLFQNQRILDALTEELDGAWPDKSVVISYEALEKLPYLTAVIKESLRMSHGVCAPLNRIVSPQDAYILGDLVPAGTVVSSCAPIIHNNSSVFPQPDQFIPERWLGDNTRELDASLVAFSKGPRSCIGINLAWCELYLIFASVVGKLRFELENTDMSMLKYRAYFAPDYGGKPFNAFVTTRGRI